uniref:Uncharacterized protein n=2 Tax=Picea TaxID=3328 RepID=A0A101LU29_PICGL|nr:hypothetical protein ABT39_MTgene3447 [Picea glauca]QHR87689.1 hypothetical protein Q903MT_gene1701 [Picea sitchensis]QHR92698.1 hypothetical protein Q903MT_gene6746 [Picea sitchensis]
MQLMLLQLYNLGRMPFLLPPKKAKRKRDGSNSMHPLIVALLF